MIGKLLNTMANTTSLSNLIRSWKKSSRKSLAAPVTVEKNLALDGRKEHVWSGMGSAGLWTGGVCEVKLRVGGGCPVSGGSGSLSQPPPPADPGQLETGAAHPNPPGRGTPKLSTFVPLMRGFLDLATSGDPGWGWGVYLWALGICVRANIPGY